jgi:hypothetical protein
MGCQAFRFVSFKELEMVVYASKSWFEIKALSQVAGQRNEFPNGNSSQF